MKQAERYSLAPGYYPYIPAIGALLAGVAGVGGIALLATATLGELRLALQRPDIWPQSAREWRDPRHLLRLLPHVIAEIALVVFALSLGRALGTMAGIFTPFPLAIGALGLIGVLRLGRDTAPATSASHQEAAHPA